VLAAPGGIVAIYRVEDEGRITCRDLRVVALRAEDGEPVVVADGRLRIAGELSGFEGVTEADVPVGVVAGGGQRARLRYPRRVVDVPVVAWVVYPNHARAIVATHDDPAFAESVSAIRRFDDDVKVLNCDLPYEPAVAE
jgi:hypothetical protein